MGRIMNRLRRRFAEERPAVLQADIRMISGCQDEQTSADVSSVRSFKLPQPAEGGGGACTSTLLSVLYQDEKAPEETLSFTQVLEKMRETLQERGYKQIPQMTASKPITMDDDFDLVPPEATGTRRAVMIGINYIGHESGVLKGCHNDVKNMKKYIKKVHKFKEDDIVVLMDDGKHDMPTRENILNAYKDMVAKSEPGDALFIHYSGHGAKIKDDDGDDADGYDETLVPVDYLEASMIRDDDLYDILVKSLPEGVHLVSLMDCCHSGTVLDLPYQYQAN